MTYRRSVVIGWSVASTVVPLMGRADVSFDGSMGSPGRLSGPSIVVPAERGSLRGANLFHSLDSFNIARSQAVSFVGPSTVRNVLVRVTGTEGSRIDGTLRSDIAGASFFLMNPNGIHFGPGTAIKVDGSFVATTASRITGADGGVFDSSLSRPTVLSSAQPAAFGFLGSVEGDIRVDRATLRVPKGQSLSLIAANIGMVDDGRRASRVRVEAESGRINLIAARSAGQVELDGASAESNVKIRSFSQLGDLLVRGYGIITTDGDVGGSIVIRGANFMLDGARVYSTTKADGVGRDVDVSLSESFVLQTRGGIFSSTEGVGDSGNVYLSAPRIDLSGGRVKDGEFSGIGTLTRGIPAITTENSGNAGDVLVRAGTLTLTANGKIASETFGRNGDGGNVRIEVAGRFEIDGASGSLVTGVSTRTTPDSLTRDPNNPRVLNANNLGRGGDIDITASVLRMSEGARIVAETGEVAQPRRGGGGTGGNIHIDVDSLLLSGHKPSDTSVSTSVRSLSYERTTGNAGDVSIAADVVRVLDGAAIQADTRGTGSAGLVSIDAADITVRGVNSAQPENTLLTSRISSLTQSGEPGGGRGGSVLIDAGVLRIDGGGTISAQATAGATGSAGLIQITGDTIAIGGGGLVEASTGSGSSGNGGDIRLGTRTSPIGRLIVNGGLISAATNGSGNGGEVTGNVEELLIARRGAIRPDSSGIGSPGRLKLEISRLAKLTDGGSIQSNATDTDGGDILLRGSTDGAVLELTNDASISTSAPAPGRDGGDVQLLLDQSILIDRGSVTTQSGGGGGSITLQPRQVVLRNAILNANAVTEDGGNITINTINYLRDPSSLITADSQLALPGTIAINNAQIDLSGVLVPLSSGLESENARLQDLCKPRPAGGASSLISEVRGGVRD